MEIDARIAKLEGEIKIMKNEVQAVLLDLREDFIKQGSISTSDDAPAPVAAQPIIINQTAPAASEPEPTPDAPEKPKPEGRKGRAKAAVAAADVEAEASAEVNEPENEAGPDGREALIIEEIVPKGSMWRQQTVTESEVEMAAQFKPARTAPAGNGETGLATIIGLAQWATRTTKQLGAERVKIILEISEMMGHLMPDTKQILVKLIDITPDGYAGEVSTRDYMVALIELANLLGKVGESEAILCSILYQKERAELLV